MSRREKCLSQKEISLTKSPCLLLKLRDLSFGGKQQGGMGQGDGEKGEPVDGQGEEQPGEVKQVKVKEIKS